LDHISTDAAEGLRLREQSLLADLQKEADSQFGELTKNANQISSNIQRLTDTVGMELKQRTDEAVGVFQLRIEQVWQEIVEQAEKRIAETAKYLHGRTRQTGPASR
jgi:hypothetical protein